MNESDHPTQLVCQRMKLERLRLGLSGLAVAKALGVSHTTVKRWEVNTPIPCDQLIRLKEVGYDTAFIATGKVDLDAAQDQDCETLALLRSMAVPDRAAIDRIIRAVAQC